jgi:magnesium-transporting ATPase (P-type)
LTSAKRQELLNDVLKSFASKCYRTILISHTSFSDEEWKQMKAQNNNFENEEDRDSVEAGLSVVGIFGLQDPLRPGIKAAVE